MINNISIVKATPSDATEIQRLTAESSRGMYKLCGWTDIEIQNHFNPERIKDGAKKLESAILSFTGSSILFIARKENRIIGCCFAEKLEDKNRIEAVYVDPEYQGIGIGKRLYDKAFDELDYNKDTYLEVFSLNFKAINFYKDIGFIETGKKFFETNYSNSKGHALEITEMVLKSNPR